MAKAGKPRKISPAVWAICVRELEAGTTYERLQAELLADGIDVSISLLAKYRAEDRRKLRVGAPESTSPVLERLQARAAARGAPQASDETDAAPRALPDFSGDLLEVLRSQLRDAAERTERARKLGDSTVAAREAKNMAELTRQLQQAERNRKDSRDVLTYTRADAEQAMQTVRAKVVSIVKRPLMCAGCARELAAALAGVDLTPPPAAS